MVWDTSKKASKVWIFLGFIGIGQLIALIYSLVSKNDKDRAFGLLFILSWLGDLIIYFTQKDKDKYLSSMALYLFIGEVLIFVVAIIFFSLGFFSTPVHILSTPVVNQSTVSGPAFAPFSLVTSLCESNGFALAFSVLKTPGSVPVTIKSISVNSSSGFITRPSVMTVPSGTYYQGDTFVSTNSTANEGTCSLGTNYTASVIIDYSYTNANSHTTNNITAGVVSGVGA